MHFDPSRRLYANVDASKAFGFGVVVYYIKDDDSSSAIADYSDTSEAPAAAIRSTYPKKSSIEPIMFLSRRLSLAEH